MDRDTTTSTTVAVSSSRLPSRCPTSASAKGWLEKLFYEEMSMEDLKMQNHDRKNNKEETNNNNRHLHYLIHSQNRLHNNHSVSQISPWKLDKANQNKKHRHRRHQHRTNRFDLACGLEANDDLLT